jgi:hypothetical protein
MKTALIAILFSAVASPLLAESPETQSPKASGDGEKYTLRYKFALGDTVRYRVDHRASVRSTIEGTTQSAVTKSDSVKAWKIIDVMPDGEMEFIHEVENVRMTNKLPDRAEMIYDSTKDEIPLPGFEDAAKAIGVPLSVIRMTPRGEVVEREIKHHQPAADAEAPVTLLLPEEPVAVGDTWNEPRTVPVTTQDGATRDIQCRRHYKLAKVAGGVASIEVSYQVLSPIDPSIESQIVQSLMKGTAEFNIDQGRIVRQQMDVDERILGFAGPASTMHYLMRMKEELIDDQTEVARRPK